MKYEWDEAKDRKNVAKHGLDFEDAEHVFPGLATRSTMTASTMGKNARSLWACLPDDEGTRIVSLRKGNQREQEIYQKRLGAA